MLNNLSESKKLALELTIFTLLVVLIVFKTQVESLSYTNIITVLWPLLSIISLCMGLFFMYKSDGNFLDENRKKTGIVIASLVSLLLFSYMFVIPMFSSSYKLRLSPDDDEEFNYGLEITTMFKTEEKDYEVLTLLEGSVNVVEKNKDNIKWMLSAENVYRKVADNSITTIIENGLSVGNTLNENQNIDKDNLTDVSDLFSMVMVTDMRGRLLKKENIKVKRIQAVIQLTPFVNELPKEAVKESLYLYDDSWNSMQNVNIPQKDGGLSFDMSSKLSSVNSDNFTIKSSGEGMIDSNNIKVKTTAESSAILSRESLLVKEANVKVTSFRTGEEGLKFVLKLDYIKK